MIGIYILLGILILLTLLIAYRARRERRMMGSALAQHITDTAEASCKVEIPEGDTAPEGYNYHSSLIIPMLHSLGCDPKTDEDGRIVFAYQGLQFLIIGPNGSPTLRIVLPAFLEVKSSDERLPRIIEMCNLVNKNWGVKCRWDLHPDFESGEIIYYFCIMTDQIIPHNVYKPDELLKSYLQTFVDAMSELRIRFRDLENANDIPNPSWNIDNTSSLSQEQMN